MNQLPRFGLVAVLCLMAAGCAAPRSQFPEVDASLSEIEADKQRDLVLQELMDAQQRLNETASRLLVAAAPICADARRSMIGLWVVNLDAFQGEYRDAAARSFGLDDRLKVLGVPAGLPAQAAGFQVGDVLVSVDGDASPRGSDAMTSWADDLAEAAKRDPEGFDVVVERDGKPKVLRVVPTVGCDYEVELAWGEDINAFADGNKVVVTRGMLRFAENDEELSLVIGHEIAHNAMGHMDARAQNAIGGAAGGLVLDILAAAVGVNTGGAFTKAGMNAGAGAYSVEFEQEADYVGMYIMARAGIPIERAPMFWRRMATLDPASMEVANTHPTSPARFVALEQTVEEIEQKLAAGRELLPEMKPEEENAGPGLTRKNG